MSIFWSPASQLRGFRRRTRFFCTWYAKRSRHDSRNDGLASRPSWGGSLRLFQQALAFPIELPALAGRQTSDTELRNFVENRINRGINVIRFCRTAGAHFGDNMKLRLGTEARLQRVPPGKLWSGATKLNEKERSADTCPKHNQRFPVVRRQSAQRPNRDKYERNPLRRDAHEELDIWVNGRKGYEDGEMKRCRCTERRWCPET